MQYPGLRFANDTLVCHMVICDALRDVQVNFLGDHSVSSSHLATDDCHSGSWGQAVHYIDEVPAEKVTESPCYCPCGHPMITISWGESLVPG